MTLTEDEYQARIVEAVLAGWMYCVACRRIHHPSDMVVVDVVADVRRLVCATCWEVTDYGSQGCQYCYNQPFYPPGVEGSDL